MAAHRIGVIGFCGALAATLLGLATSRISADPFAPDSQTKSVAVPKRAAARAKASVTSPAKAPLAGVVMPRDVASAWAQAEMQNDPEARRRGLLAALRMWAEVDPVAAMQWAIEQQDVAGPLALEAALTGAARQPEIALALGRALLAADPSFAREHGGALLRALGDAGQFGLALEFARETPPDLVSGLTVDVFHQWAVQQPLAAIDAVQSLDDGPLRRDAFDEVMVAWAGSDPTAAASYLLTQPPGQDRDKAFRQTISLWAERDAVTLAQWLDGLPAGPDFDTGAASLVALAENKFGQPDTALPWIDMITDPVRKRDALRRVLLGWRDTSPAAAQSYLSQVRWLSGDERAALFRQLASSP